MSGTRHPRIRFTYGGTEHQVTVASTPGDSDAVSIKMGDVRRMLNMNTNGNGLDHTPERPAPAPPADDSTGGVAFYKKNDVRFKVPKSMIGAMSGRKFDILESGEYQWEIVPGSKYSVRFMSGSHVICAAVDGGALFGMTPAEYVTVDDHILVRLLEPPRFKGEARAAVPGEQQPPAEPRKRRSRVVVPAAKVPGDADLQGLLDALRRMEADTPWRVLRVDGRLVFQARIE